MEMIKKLNEIANEIISKSKKYDFNTSDLPDFVEYKDRIFDSEIFGSIYSTLNNYTGSCLYWFSLENEEKTNEFNTLLNENRSKLLNPKRVVPPQNKNINSNTFYVGIRRGGIRKKDSFANISGRFIQHLGYYNIGTTQGLQLVHWAKGHDFKITYNVFELVDIPNEYLNAIELIVAHKLRPLCGKH